VLAGNVGCEPQLVVSVPLGCLSLQAEAADGRAGTAAGTTGTGGTGAQTSRLSGDLLLHYADALLADHAQPLQRIQSSTFEPKLQA